MKNTIRTTFVAFLLLFPITGLILDGFDVDILWTRPAALTLLVAILAAFYFTAGHRFTRKITSLEAKTYVGPPPAYQRTTLWIVGLLAVLLPCVLSKYWISISILILIYVLLGLGLNIVVGLAGLLDLGYVAFYAVGAYTYALGHMYFGLSFWLAIPIAAAAAGLFGAILAFPVLRMHGDYLAIVTLGFGEIIRLVLNNWADMTGGPNGVMVPAPSIFGYSFSRLARDGGTPFHSAFNLPYSSEYRYLFLYFLLLIIVMGMIFFITRIKHAPMGRAWEALRENEIAARALGINHVTTKLSAFSLGAMFGGIGGVFFAAYAGFVNPSSFTFIESAIILAIVVLGGMGSTLGVIIAAVVLTLLPEVLREFSDYRMLAFGMLMVAMMIVKPRGFISVRRPIYERNNAQ